MTDQIDWSGAPEAPNGLEVYHVDGDWYCNVGEVALYYDLDDARDHKATPFWRLSLDSIENLRGFKSYQTRPPEEVKAGQLWKDSAGALVTIGQVHKDECVCCWFTEHKNLTSGVYSIVSVQKWQLIAQDGSEVRA